MSVPPTARRRSAAEGGNQPTASTTAVSRRMQPTLSTRLARAPDRLMLPTHFDLSARPRFDAFAQNLSQLMGAWEGGGSNVEARNRRRAGSTPLEPPPACENIACCGAEPEPNGGRGPKMAPPGAASRSAPSSHREPLAAAPDTGRRTGRGKAVQLALFVRRRFAISTPLVGGLFPGGLPSGFTFP